LFKIKQKNVELNKYFKVIFGDAAVGNKIVELFFELKRSTNRNFEGKNK